ncbi:MAG TPA: uracil-DNA glycosylase [Gemmatimonadales bacterium]|nr:uracil-DNA glycosylase [Gemmatimonadales bacterium]
MADEWRRYLRQQIELGGPEVILPAGDALAPAAAAAAAETDTPAGAVREAVREAVGEEVEMPRRTSTPRAGAPPAGNGSAGGWRVGAPPIPGPGYAVEPPPPDLVDEVASLPTLEAVAERIRTTMRCPLCPGRTNAVPGEGNPKAELVLVGEGPGATEDATGRPFVGAAGQLLDKMLAAIDISRDDVFITNIVKCRPPQNRKPLPDEVAACIPYLHRQLALIRPKVVLCLGATAGESLLGVRKSLGELRGKVHTYAGIPLIVTYHPAALLRNPNWKKPTWDDLRIARQLLER